MKEIWCTYVVAAEVVDGGLGQHGVVLQLALAERGGVASDDDQLGLAGTKALQRRLVAESDCAGFVNDGCQLQLRQAGGSIPLPDFMTSANLELMLLASFLLFF